VALKGAKPAKKFEKVKSFCGAYESRFFEPGFFYAF
jgi:hypothetical protein